MFVVAPVTRVHQPATNDTPEGFSTFYPVVFEDEAQGYAHPPVAQKNSRADAQELAEALNAVLSELDA